VSDPDDTLHEVTEVAVIRHLDLGVLLLHSSDRRWHFPDSTVRVGEPWDESLRRAVRSATGIGDLRRAGPGRPGRRPVTWRDPLQHPAPSSVVSG
jgi:hypothetical protein